MTDLRKAAEMALEALESFCGRGYSALALSKRCDAAIKALRQALAEPEQEPVAYEVDADVINSHGQSEYRTFLAYRPDPAMTTGGIYEVTKVLEARPLYTAPPSIEAAVLAEREACAKVADGWPDYDVEGLAEAIRARGNHD